MLHGGSPEWHTLMWSAQCTCVCKRHALCLQVRVTGDIRRMLPSFLPSFFFGPPVALDKLVIDNERHIMYSLASNSAIEVSGARALLN